MSKVILYSDDVSLICYWEKALNHECVIIDDITHLSEIKDSIIIANFSACEPTCKEFILKMNKASNRILVLHRTPTLLNAKEVLKSGAYGYGNAFMKAHFIISAVETIKEGMIWLYPEFISAMITEIPTNNQNKTEEVLASLSQREKEVALLLKDGEKYQDIADKLGITPRTIKAHAQSIYTKLNIKDRLALALLLR